MDSGGLLYKYYTLFDCSGGNEGERQRLVFRIMLNCDINAKIAVLGE
jgi:hypothetical protein